MPDESSVPRWFCRNAKDGIEGPFDLLELASLLRDGDISADTLTQREGEESWAAFKSRQEFESARTVPADAIYRHLKERADEEESPWSLRRLYYLGWLVFGTIGYALFHRYSHFATDRWFVELVSNAVHRVLGH